MLSDVFIWGRWPQCEQHGVHLINVVLALLHVFFRHFKCDKRVFGLYFWKHCFVLFFFTLEILPHVILPERGSKCLLMSTKMKKIIL